MKKYNSIKRNLLKDKSVKREYDNLKISTAIIGKIIELRLKNNLSQDELAKKLGTKQPSIARLESGTINPTISYLAQVAKALNRRLIVEFK